MEILAPIGLVSVTAALLAVPVMPAVYELHKRGDVAPLPTSRHDGKIENFAEALRSRIAPLLSELEQCRISGEVRRTNLDGMEILLAGREDFNFRSESIRGLDAVLCSRAAIPAGRLVHADVYSAGDLHIGEGTAIRAALADGDITIARGGSVLRWIHGVGGVHLHKGVSSYGRLSSFESIRLETGCRFQRVHAPNIFTLDSAANAGPAPLNAIPSANGDASSTAEIGVAAGNAFTSRPRVRVHGDFVVPACETTRGNVIATGGVKLGAHSEFYGSVKSYKDMIVDEGARVCGSIVCGGTLQLGPNCFVAGPVMAEREIRISRGARIGAPDSLTTISSFGIEIATGCRIHGTIWARVRGTVED